MRQDGPPDVILLDRMMPEMDSFQGCRGIAEAPRMAQHTCHHNCARDLTNEDRARLNFGIETVMMKDAFSPAKLIQRIHELPSKPRVAEVAS